MASVTKSAFFKCQFVTDSEIFKQRDRHQIRDFGEVNLADSVWLEAKDNVEIYRFFKVEVEVK